MSFCALCPHFTSEHEDDEPGASCLARYGAWGESFLEAEQPFETCMCPGLEVEAIHV